MTMIMEYHSFCGFDCLGTILYKYVTRWCFNRPHSAGTSPTIVMRFSNDYVSSHGIYDDESIFETT